MTDRNACPTAAVQQVKLQKAGYESLPFATRARLHERLADFLEEAYPEAPPVEALAFHYGRSENVEKQREYLRKAGGVAQKNFANDAALAYYGQLLPLLHDAAEKIEIHLMRGKVLELMGQIDEAERECSTALDMAGQDPAAKAGAQFALGKLSRLRGDYDTALERLKQAREMRIVIGDRLGLVQVSIETGMVLLRKGEYAEARQPLYEGLALAREVGDKAGTALANRARNRAVRGYSPCDQPPNLERKVPRQLQRDLGGERRREEAQGSHPLAAVDRAQGRIRKSPQDAQGGQQTRALRYRVLHDKSRSRRTLRRVVEGGRQCMGHR